MSDDAGQALGSALGPHHAFLCCLMQLLSLLSAVATFGSFPKSNHFSFSDVFVQKYVST